MDEDKERQSSQLFLVRLWLDAGAGDGTSEEHTWRGKVQHVVTGKAGSFTNQATMMQLLASMSSSPVGETNELGEHQVTPDSIASDTQH